MTAGTIDRTPDRTRVHTTEQFVGTTDFGQALRFYVSAMADVGETTPTVILSVSPFGNLEFRVALSPATAREIAEQLLIHADIAETVAAIEVESQEVPA